MTGVLQDPRASQLGLGQLQHAVRHSFEVLQHALGGGSRGQGLSDPLLRGHDVGGHGVPALTGHGGGGLLAGRGCLNPMVILQMGALGIHFGAQVVNKLFMVDLAMQYQLSVLSPAAVEVEKIRERVLREAEQNFARELQKLEKGDSATATPQRTVQEPWNLQRLSEDELAHLFFGGPPDVPPGLTGVFGGHRGSGESRPPKPGSDSMTAFPPLPAPSTENAALLFQDWMTIIAPWMGDLSASSKEFRELVQEGVSVKYNEWLVASPLARLRIKVEGEVPVRFQRMGHVRARHCSHLCQMQFGEKLWLAEKLPRLPSCTSFTLSTWRWR